MEVTNADKRRWKLFNLKRKALMSFGFKTGLIQSYDVETIDNLRKLYYGGIPCSIIILSHGMCIRKCYDRATLLTYGFNDDVEFRQVDADVDSIKYHPGTIAHETGNDPHYSNHSFIERKRPDGSWWVYDTTDGLVYYRPLYYLLERPKITKINDKETVKFFRKELYTVRDDISRDIAAVPLILPQIETLVANSYELYEEHIQKEFEMFKELIGYDELCRAQQEEKRAHFAKKSGK